MPRKGQRGVARVIKLAAVRFHRVSTVRYSMTVPPSGCRARNGESEKRR